MAWTVRPPILRRSTSGLGAVTLSCRGLLEWATPTVSAFGTEPRAPEQRLELTPGTTAAIGQIGHHAQQTLGGRERVAGSPMAVRDLDPVVSGHVVERAARKLRKNLAGDFHRAEATPLQLAAGRARHLCRHESPIEGRVVRDEHVSLENTQQILSLIHI